MPENEYATTVVAEQDELFDFSQELVDEYVPEVTKKRPGRQKIDWRASVDQLGLSIDEIRDRLSYMLSVQSASKISAKTVSRFLEWYQGGQSIAETARTMGLTPPRVYFIIHEVTRALESQVLPEGVAVRDLLSAIAIQEAEERARRDAADATTSVVDSESSPRNKGAHTKPVPGDDWFIEPVHLGMPGIRQRRDDNEPNALAWQSDSLCAQTDPDAFFPEKGGSTREAKKICKSCEVRTTCLHYALENDERFGIWGGLSERERRKLRKRA